MKQMAREILLDALGRAFEIWGSLRDRIFYNPLLNERGQAGEGDPSSGDEPNPGDDALEHTDSSKTPSAGDDETPASDEGDTPGETPGEKTEAKPPDKTPADQTPPGEKPTEEMEQLQAKIAQLEADLTQANEMAQFYGNFYQQSLESQQRPVQQTPRQQMPGLGTGQVAEGQLPEGIIAPENWDSQQDTANWVNHSIQAQLQQGYEQVVLPILQKITASMQGLQLSMAKSGKEDWDEIYQEAMNEIFTVGPDGKVLGIKNQPLLAYFQSQMNPYAAMYQYGLTKKMPDKIKKQVTNQSKKVIEAIGKKPKGPTHPKGGEVLKEDADLDWDTSPEDVEKILDKRGLI